MPVATIQSALRVERAKGFLREMRELAPDDLQAVVVSLQATLGNTTPGSYTYKAPADSDFVILSIHGFMRFTALNSENTSLLGWLNLTPTERWLVKAMNCTVHLENIDRKHLFTDENDPTLSALMPPMGYPIVFPPEAPGMLPAGENLRATFTLQDSTSSVVGASTVYGLAVSGVLVPRK